MSHHVASCHVSELMTSPFHQPVTEDEQTTENPMESESAGELEICPVMPMQPQLMKAMRIAKHGPPEELSLHTDVPIPQPADDEVLIKVFTIGVNPFDVLCRTGVFTAGQTFVFPHILGCDCAGIVLKTGSKVFKFQVGERVYTNESRTGTYAEYAVAKAIHVHRLHDSLTFSQGAALGVAYFTAYKALFLTGGGRPGQNVLIHGASGGVGVACCQLARAHGMRVVGTAGSDKGEELVKTSGAHISANHSTESYTDFLKKVTRGEGYDLIIEMEAPKNLQADLDLLKKHGTVVVVGGSYGKKTEIDPLSMCLRQTRILGVEESNMPQSECEEVSAFIHAGIDQGWLRPVIGSEYPLTAAADAHREIEAHPGGSYGKIIMSN